MSRRSTPHVGNILGTDGKKLSKRHGAVSVDEFRAAGYLPDAVVNFLALIGWAPDGETTIMSRSEIVERFTLESVSASPGTFDYAKLDWMNGVHLRALEPQRLRGPPRPVGRRERSRLARRARPRGGGDRAGEDQPLRRVPRVRRLPLSRRRVGSRTARRARLARRAGCAGRPRPVGEGNHRRSVERALRGARREAPHRVSARSGLR